MALLIHAGHDRAPLTSKSLMTSLFEPTGRPQ